MKENKCLEKVCFKFETKYLLIGLAFSASILKLENICIIFIIPRV